MEEQRSRRNLIVAVAALAVAAVAIVLVIVLSGDDNGGGSAVTPVTTAPSGTTGTTGKSKRKGGGRSRKTPEARSPKERERQPTGQIRQRTAGSGTETIQVDNGRPVDGLVRLIYDHGDLVQLRIVTNRTERVVISGLDLSDNASPGHDAEFSFPASQPGLYGVEIRRGGTRSRIAVLAIH